MSGVNISDKAQHTAIICNASPAPLDSRAEASEDY